jgi:hypothetical protein
MRSFTSLDDLKQLPINDPAYPHVQRLIETCLSHEGYDPEADGWIVLIDEDDIGKPLPMWDDGTRLEDLLWEGFTRVDGYFQGIYLANNQFGIVFLIPDAPWLNPELRELIEETLDP